MKILYFYQYFSTSEGSWGTRVYDFGREWVKAGHEVTVVSAVYSKSDLKPRGLISRQSVEGIDLRVLNILIDNKQSFWARVRSFLVYAVMSSWFALTTRADLVIASSGPITVGIPGLVARWLRGRKLVFEARDLWPEGAIRLGLLRNPLVARLAYLFESLCYRSSSLVIGLSEGIRDDIKRRFPTCRVESVTNSVNLELFCRPAELCPTPKPHSYALYFGNIGSVNHSNFLLDAAAVLLRRGRADISIILIGEGALKDELKARKIRDGLTNVQFIDLMPKTVVVGYVQNALASVVPLKPLPVLDTSSPNKLFEAMAAGRPTIQTTQGWIKALFERYRCGFTVSAQKPEELADLLILLKSDPALANEIGQRGRETAQAYFDKNVLASRMLAYLQAA